jgi:hypothetical protein
MFTDKSIKMMERMRQIENYYTTYRSGAQMVIFTESDRFEVTDPSEVPTSFPKLCRY